MADMDDLPPPLEGSEDEDAPLIHTINGHQQSHPPPMPFEPFNPSPADHPNMLAQLQQLQSMYIDMLLAEHNNQQMAQSANAQQGMGTHPGGAIVTPYGVVRAAPPATGVEQSVPSVAAEPESVSSDTMPPLLAYSDSDSDGPEAPAPFTPHNPQGGDSDSQWATTEDESCEDENDEDEDYEGDSYEDEYDYDSNEEVEMDNAWTAPDNYFYCGNCGCFHRDDGWEDESNEDGEDVNEDEGDEDESLPPPVMSEASDNESLPDLDSGSSSTHSSPVNRPIRTQSRTAPPRPCDGLPSLIDPESSGDESESDMMPPLADQSDGSDNDVPVRVSIPSPNRSGNRNRRSAPNPAASIGGQSSNRIGRTQASTNQMRPGEPAFTDLNIARFLHDTLLDGYDYTQRMDDTPPTSARDQEWILSQARAVQSFLSAYTSAYVPAYTNRHTRSLYENGHVDVGCGVYTYVYVRTYVHAYMCALTACLLQAADAFEAPPPMKYELTWSVYIDPLD